MAYVPSSEISVKNMLTRVCGFEKKIARMEALQQAANFDTYTHMYEQTVRHAFDRASADRNRNSVHFLIGICNMNIHDQWNHSNVILSNAHISQAQYCLFILTLPCLLSFFSHPLGSSACLSANLLRASTKWWLCSYLQVKIN